LRDGALETNRPAEKRAYERVKSGTPAQRGQGAEIRESINDGSADFSRKFHWATLPLRETVLLI
jgi:hypothetical protein